MRLKLEELMLEHRITQAQLADSLGIGRASVNSWIAGQMKNGERVNVFPTYAMLERLCRFFRCTPNDLLEMDGEPEEKTIADACAKAVSRMGLPYLYVRVPNPNEAGEE